MVDVPVLSQMDPRWKEKPLGFASITIGKYGCLMTCMAMVANVYGFQETPDTVNEKMKKARGFQGALIMPAVFPAAVPGMVFRDFIDCENTPAPMAEIDATLAQGKPVIVEVDYAPTPGLQNHWIVLYEKRGSDYLLRDPWPFPVQTAEVTLLTSRYKFAGAPARIIQGVVFLEGGRPPAPKPKTTLDQGVRASFPVYATADGLALRSETLVADATLLKRVPVGAKLTALENDTAVKAKLGVINQWLAVLDPSDNTQGYAAAWYLAAEPPGKPAEPPLPPPAPAARQLIVKTTDEGVALRSRPAIAAETLVRRVPASTELVCLEPVEDALKKVGVMNQWLKVADVTRKEYFVAAWYVRPVNGQAALGVMDEAQVNFALPTQEPEPLVVRSAVDGLAFRCLPQIAASTLLRRLPMDGELVALEDPYLAENKLGKMGQWLRVRDIQGAEGYVAAWYAVKRPDLAIEASRPVLG